MCRGRKREKEGDKLHKSDARVGDLFSCIFTSSSSPLGIIMRRSNDTVRAVLFHLTVMESVPVGEEGEREAIMGRPLDYGSLVVQ